MRKCVRWLRNLYYLIGVEYRLIGKQILLLCLASFLIGQVLYIVSLTPYNNGDNRLYRPFEQIVDQSGQALLALLTLLTALAVVAFELHKQFGPTKSIYRLYQLETGSSAIYLAKVLAGMTFLLQVLVTPLLGAACAWPLYYLPATALVIPGSLALAFSRSALLHLLLPTDLWLALLQMATLALAVCLVLSATLEMHKPGKTPTLGIVLVLAATILLASAYRGYDEANLTTRIITLLGMIALAFVTGWRGRYLLHNRRSF